MERSDFNYQPNTLEVKGSKLHYIQAGEGDPIVFIHGIPTWSYLWRNIIPHLQEHGRGIALDLIGCGRSDKPEIQYSIHDHIDYFTEFMQQLNLERTTLVMHGWGSVIGSHYAMNHQQHIKGLVYLESHLRPPTQRDMLSLPVQEVITFLKQADFQEKLLNSNYYVEKILQSGVLRRLDAEELSHYLEPYEKPGSRQPIWQYLQELPLGDNETPAHEIIKNYSAWLQQSEIPKLLLYAVPGFVTTMDTVGWAAEHFPRIEVEEVGEALHYAQETVPDAIGEAISTWYQSL